MITIVNFFISFLTTFNPFQELRLGNFVVIIFLTLISEVRFLFLFDEMCSFIFVIASEFRKAKIRG